MSARTAGISARAASNLSMAFISVRFAIMLDSIPPGTLYTRAWASVPMDLGFRVLLSMYFCLMGLKKSLTWLMTFSLRPVSMPSSSRA